MELSSMDGRLLTPGRDSRKIFKSPRPYPYTIPRSACYTPLVRERSWVPTEPANPPDDSDTGNLATTPVVQFSSSDYFVVEGEDAMTILIWRIGNLEGRSEVCYATRDSTAVAGVNYVQTSGKLIFEPGESEKEVTVPIINNDNWGPTLEFFIELYDAELAGAIRGRYLWQASLRIADNDTFPTDKFPRKLLEEGSEEIDGFALMVEYFKLQMKDQVVRKGTIKMMLVNLGHTLYMVMRLFVNVYLLDRVLNMSESVDKLVLVQERHASLLIIMVLTMLPFVFLHFFDYRKIDWKVGGRSRAILQKAMLRRYLQYDDYTRSQLRESEILLTILHDAPALVASGFMNTIAFVFNVVQLAMILGYQMTAPYVFGKPFHYQVLIPHVFFPGMMAIFDGLRRARTLNVLNTQSEKQKALAECVQQTIDDYRLISDYNFRLRSVDQFEGTMGGYNKAAADSLKMQLNNGYFPQWLTTICVAVYTLSGGMAVIEGASMGMFVTNLQIIATVGQQWGGIYTIAMALTNASPSLRNIGRLLNLPIDIPLRARLHRCKTLATRALRAELRSTGGAGVPLDRMPIRIEDLDFSYASGTGMLNRSRSVVKHIGVIQVDQSQLVSVVGKPGDGKSTLLKLLGGAMLQNVPEGGSAGIFVPSHLRVLHVAPVPMFIDGSLYDNLTLGVRPDSGEARIEHVLGICRRLPLPESILAYVMPSNGPVLAWDDVLSETQKQLLSLVRALVANFEVIAIHKPTQAFSDATSTTVLQLLKEHVANRGLRQSPATASFRRPRTVFFTSSKVTGVEMADSVLYVTRQGIQQIEKGTVTMEMCA